MNWKEQLEKFERSNNWDSAIELLKKTIDASPDNVEAYIRAIYVMHNILVEEDYLKSDHKYLAELIKHYFDASYEKFADNPQYLFFIGKILYIAEWYFGINDDFKPIEEKRAFKMQKKAFDKEPDNALFEWAFRFSLNDTFAGYLAEKILLNDKSKVEWLKLQGFPGQYILKSLERSKENLKQSP